MNLPYVYKLTHKETNQFYIGYREANKVRSFKDLGFKYFSSSKSIKKLGFKNFNIEILAEFINPKDAYDFEQLFIKENLNDPLCLNISCYHNKLNFRCPIHSEETKNKISNSTFGRIHSTETKLKMSMLKLGKPQSESHKKNRANSKRIFSLCLKVE